MDTTTMALIRQATRKIQILAGHDAKEWENMAIEERNDLLDEYRRAEETIDALADARKEAKGW